MNEKLIKTMRSESTRLHSIANRAKKEAEMLDEAVALLKKGPATVPAPEVRQKRKYKRRKIAFVA